MWAAGEAAQESGWLTAPSAERRCKPSTADDVASRVQRASSSGLGVLDVLVIGRKTPAPEHAGVHPDGGWRCGTGARLLSDLHSVPKVTAAFVLSMALSH